MDNAENVIVTGGTGFLGRNMVRRLAGEGYRVFAPVRPESHNIDQLPRGRSIVPVFCNLSDLLRAPELQGRRFSALYHFAWAGVNRSGVADEVVQNDSLNTSLSVLDAAIRLGVGCFLFAGSRSEYGRQNGPFAEDAECNPIVPYGKAKLEFSKSASQICRGTGTRFIHARIFSVYGIDDHPWSLISTAISRMRKNLPMDLSPCTHLWNYMEISDMTDLLLTFHRRCAEIPEEDNGIFNVATRDVRPLREFVEEIYSIVGSQSDLNFGAFMQSEESSFSVVPDMTRVENLFGWKPAVTFSEGIKKIVRQLEDQNA